MRILFVCLGNICRSPMAEFVMKDLLSKCPSARDWAVDSAATDTQELGNPIYPPALRQLERHGVPVGPHAARLMTRADYARYDLLIGMDEANLRDMRAIAGGDPAGKIHRLLDYTDRPGNVADPWFTGNFDAAWRDITEGCRALLDALL